VSALAILHSLKGITDENGVYGELSSLVHYLHAKDDPIRMELG
jgi:hypothetical protein